MNICVFVLWFQKSQITKIYLKFLFTFYFIEQTMKYNCEQQLQSQ